MYQLSNPIWKVWLTINYTCIAFQTITLIWVVKTDDIFGSFPRVARNPYAMRMWLKVVSVLLFVWGFVIPTILLVVANWYDMDRRGPMDGGSDFGLRSASKENLYHDRKPLDYNPELHVGREEMHYQVNELEQIVFSVRNELRNLEQDRSRVRKDVEISRNALSKVRREVATTKTDLQTTKGKLAKTLREMKRASQQNQIEPVKSSIVVVNLPPSRKAPQEQHSAADNGGQLEGEGTKHSERLYFSSFVQSSFDHSRCPLTMPFGVYLYNQHNFNVFDLKHPELVDHLVSSLTATSSLVNKPDQACVFVVIIGPLKETMAGDILQRKLESLPHWGGGSNHIVINLAYSNETNDFYLETLSFGKAIHARSYTSGCGVKACNDLLLPPVIKHAQNGLTPFLPALRRLFIFFEGNMVERSKKRSLSHLGTNLVLLRQQLDSLKEAITANTHDQVLITTTCNAKVDTGGTSPSLGEWELCSSPMERAHFLSQSTFSLVINGDQGSIGPLTYLRLMEALNYGAIPVLIGIEHLPLDEVIDWKAVGIVVPPTSLGQLHYILRNIDADTILKYRRQGRFLWDTYFSSSSHILASVLAVVRWRALHPPPAAKDYIAMSTLFSITGEILPLPSYMFMHNFTTYGWEFWNTPPGPFYMYPVTPFNPAPVSGSQYTILTKEQIPNLPQHVIIGGGITGPYFEDFLLGNVPKEQFTVVILTYERNQVLIEAVTRLRDLDHLAKVVVVWNNPNPPPSSFKWPEIGVAIDVSLSDV